MPVEGTFYEDDQPLAEILSAWEAGEKGITRPPRRMVEVTAEVPAGLDEAAVDAMLGALDDLGVSGMGGSVLASAYETAHEQIARLRARVAELEATLSEQTTALAFETTCSGCGRSLVAAHDAEARAEAAEAQVARVRQAIRRELGNRRVQGLIDLGAYGRTILAALDAAGTPAATPEGQPPA